MDELKELRKIADMLKDQKDNLIAVVLGLEAKIKVMKAETEGLREMPPDLPRFPVGKR